MKSSNSHRSFYLLGLLLSGLLLGACSTCSSGNCDNGQGTYTFGQYSEFAGDQYVGEFENDVFHGQGTHTDANGDQYVGEWRGGMRHGQGTITLEGVSLTGIWEDDEFVEILE